jgi:hypothetical protein
LETALEICLVIAAFPTQAFSGLPILYLATTLFVGFWVGCSSHLFWVKVVHNKSFSKCIGNDRPYILFSTNANLLCLFD